MVGEKFLPADIIEHVLNLRRLGVQKSIWNDHNGYFWAYQCSPEENYAITIVAHKEGLAADIRFEFGTSAAWSAVVNAYLNILD